MLRVFLFFVLLLPFCLSAQRTPQRIDGPRGQKIGFYQYLPPGYKENAGTKYPVIIFLHGIGEKGTGLEPDLNKINCCGVPRYIADGNPMTFTWNGKKEGFIVLFPQLDSKYSTWQNYYIDELIRYGTQKLHGDSNRVFLTGLSLGGGGTWTYASASVSNAKKLAGLIPVVSPCFMTNGCNIANANLPVVVIHALDDVMASPSCTFKAVSSINNCGAAAHPNLILYANGGHYVWVKRAYETGYDYHNPNIYEWMLAQSRSLPPNIKPIAVAGNDITISATSGVVNLDAGNSTDPDGKVVRYVWRKVSGPAYGIMSGDVSVSPHLSGLTSPGVYKFEVRVVDDRAEWSTDSVLVTVVSAGASPVNASANTSHSK